MKTSRWLILVLGVGFLIILFGSLLSGGLSGVSRVRRVNGDDPKLTQAIATARAGLPGFLEQVSHPKPGQRFAIMGRFKSKEGNEYLWVKDPTYQSGKLTGLLDQVPIAVPHHKGDTVTVTTEDVVDWLVRDEDGAMQGRFTEAANHS